MILPKDVWERKQIWFKCELENLFYAQYKQERFYNK
jgi:hypothetical protein